MVNPGAGGGPTPPSPLAYHELLNERDALRRRLDRLAVEVSLVTCHKCGGDCALMHLTDGRCPKCLAAEVVANSEAVAAEVVRLAHAEANWRHVMADRDHLFKELAEARAERDRFKAAIIEHYDQRGDDRCWLDDLKLYNAVGLAADPYVTALPPEPDMLESCRRYIRQRQCPVVAGSYPMPGGMTISQLTAELEAFRGDAGATGERQGPS